MVNPALIVAFNPQDCLSKFHKYLISLKQGKDLFSHVCANNTWKDAIVRLAQKFNQAKLGKVKITLQKKNLNKLTIQEIQPSDTVSPADP